MPFGEASRRPKKTSTPKTRTKGSVPDMEDASTTGAADAGTEPASMDAAKAMSAEADVRPVGDSANVATAPPQQAEAPRSGDGNESALDLTIADVRVLRTSMPGLTGVRFSPSEAFLVRVRLALQRLDVPLHSVAPLSFQVRVQAYEMSSGTYTMLATDQATVGADSAEITIDLQASGLPPGLYRLVTLATLGDSADVAGLYDGPVVTVAGAWPAPQG